MKKIIFSFIAFIAICSSLNAKQIKIAGRAKEIKENGNYVYLWCQLISTETCCIVNVPDDPAPNPNQRGHATVYSIDGKKTDKIHFKNYSTEITPDGNELLITFELP